MIPIDKLQIFEEYKPFLQSGHNATVMWTTMIQAYSSRGLASQAIQLFHNMQQDGVDAEEHTYSCILSAISELQQGQRIHVQLMVSHHFRYSLLY